MNLTLFHRGGRRGVPVHSCFGLLVALLLAGCAQAPVNAPISGPSVEPAQPVVVAPKRPPKIALALGGGAARGFAHVGVIQVLEESGLRPAFLAGTSAGSLVAAIYASGKTGAQLQQVAESMEEVAITDWTLPIFSRGMFRGDALARYVNQLVGGQLIENMPMRLGIVATDLNSVEDLYPTLAQSVLRGTYRLDLRGDLRQQQVRRQALMQVRFTQVSIRPPDRLGKHTPPLPVYAIESRECAATVPAGEKPVHWRLPDHAPD